MKKYKVEIRETLSRVVEIEANSSKEALETVEDLYLDCAYVLDENDFKRCEFFNVTDNIIM